MPLPAFPSIRAPSADGWDGATPDGVKRTAMDAGPAKQRRDSSAEGAVENFTYKVVAADRDTLDTFYQDHGAERFTYTHGVWGNVEACFAGPIRWVKKGIWFTARVQLTIYR
jgi:hypothetical protein